VVLQFFDREGNQTRLLRCDECGLEADLGSDYLDGDTHRCPSCDPCLLDFDVAVIWARSHAGFEWVVARLILP
jgi:hypothetical protein